MRKKGRKEDGWVNGMKERRREGSEEEMMDGMISERMRDRRKEAADR